MSIKSVQFVNTVAIGPDCFSHTNLYQDMITSSYRITLAISPDNMFLQVTGTHTEKPAIQYHQLIPLLNVASVMLDKDLYGKPATAPAKTK